MNEQTRLVWLHEAIQTIALPSPRGRRLVGLSLRGELIALGRVSEADYQTLIAGGRVSAGMERGGLGGSSDGARDNG